MATEATYRVPTGNSIAANAGPDRAKAFETSLAKAISRTSGSSTPVSPPVANSAKHGLPNQPEALSKASSSPPQAPTGGSGGHRGGPTSTGGQQPVPGPHGTADLANKVLSTVAPDAIVYSNNWLNKDHTRHFVLVNPLAGTASQFISHKDSLKKEIWGGQFNRVETIHYSLKGTGTRREDGYGFSKSNAAKDLTFFVNIRGGDTNLVNNVNGLSGNVGFFGSPARLRGVADAMSRSGNGRMRGIGEGIDQTLRAAAASGQQVGLAWRGTLTYDTQSKQAVLDISGLKVPLKDFQKSFEIPASYNYGDANTARNNNIDSYLQGENPFELARYTRRPTGTFINHGDSVSSIAARIHHVQERLYPDTSRNIRTNSDVQSVLVGAIEARDASLMTPDRRRWMNDLGTWIDPGGPALAPVAPAGSQTFKAQDRAYLNQTLATLHQYGIAGLYGPKVQREAALQARNLGVSGAPKDKDFVRDVFQGRFRPIESYDAGDLARDVFLGLNRYTAIVTAVFEPRPTANDSLILQQRNSAISGLQSRLNATHGGVLRALGLPSGGRQGADYARHEHQVMQALHQVLETKVRKDNGTSSAQALYEAFLAMPQAERSQLRALINASLNLP